MKIAALIPLILEMNTSVDFLNLNQNVEEYNFDWICRRTLFCNVEVLGSIRQHSGTRIRSWPISRRTRSSWNLSREIRNSWTQVFKSVFKFFLVELPCDPNFKLKISCSTRDECNLFHNKISNNCTLSNQ